MALILKDRVLETSQTSGTGTIALSGAVNGFQTFSSAIGNTNTTYYAIVDDADNQWEVGLGTVGAGTLTRDTVYSSSNSGSKVNFGTSIKNVFCDYPASKSVNLDANGKVSFGGNTYEDFTSTTAPSYSEGRVWYDSTEKALAFYNDSSSLAVHVSQDLIFKVINNTGSTIPNGSPVYITSTSSGQSYPNVALAKADVAATSAVIGLTNGAIANGATGYVSSQGTIDNVNTSTFTVGQVLYLSPYSAGQLMNTIPPTGITVQVGVATYIDSSAGHIYVKQTTPLAVPASIVTGTLGVDHGGTGQSSALVAGAVVYGSSTTAMGVTAAGTSGQVLTSAGTGTPTWTTPTTGTVTSVGGTGTVSGISLSGTVTSSGNLTLGGTLDLSSPPAIGATTSAAGTFTTITGQTEVLRTTGNNLFTKSQTFNTFWTAGGANITATDNAVTAPDSTTTAANIVPTVTNGLHRIYTPAGTLSVYSGTIYTLSFYIKANGYRYVFFNSSNLGISSVFDVQAGTVSTSTGTATITSVGNSWYRCTATGTSTLNGVPNVYLQINNTYATGDQSFAGDGTSSIYFWGGQLEIGSSATTYVPTTTAGIWNIPSLSFASTTASQIGLQSDGALYVSPAGTGALQAQATTSTTVGGNARGANAVDWQTSRSSAGQVAGSSNSVIAGGINNTTAGAGAYSCIAGGANNNTTGAYMGALGGGGYNNLSAYYSVLTGGYANSVAGGNAFLGGGVSNSAAGYHNIIVGGYSNSGTSASAVTTQSGTMNATTAVTLSGSNASIKVGQIVTGTSISGSGTGNYTYVAAISGTALTLSQAASGSSTSTLSFYTPHGVVVGGGNNQATGSYSFIGGGGDAGTAANRNVASGDWSVVTGGFKNQATGIYSTVTGGFTNTASGWGSIVLGGASQFNGNGNTSSGNAAIVLGGAANNSTGFFSNVIGGEANTANSSYSYALGSYGTTRGIFGNVSYGIAYGFGSYSQGKSQYSFLGLFAATTNATATALTSDGSAAGTTNQVILPNNSAYFFRGEVVSGVTGGGNTKGWTIEGVIKRGANAASTALVGTPTVMSSYADVGAATWTIAVTADTTNGGLAVTFTGQAATTIRTVAQIRTTEMTY